MQYPEVSQVVRSRHGVSERNALILFGVPSAGKSTLARNLQTMFRDLIVLDTDDIAYAAGRVGVPAPDGFMICFHLLKPFLQRNCESNTNLIFCAGIPDRERFAMATAAFEEASNMRYHLVNVLCDVEIASERVQSRNSVQAVSNSLQHITAIRDFHLEITSGLDGVIFLRNENSGDKLDAMRVLSDLLFS